jgi:hypothetical protein
LKGSGGGHALLNFVPSGAFAGPIPLSRRWRAQNRALEFQPAASGFAAAAMEIAAMQRGWRDFRIAQ